MGVSLRAVLETSFTSSDLVAGKRLKVEKIGYDLLQPFCLTRTARIDRILSIIITLPVYKIDISQTAR